MSTTLLRTIIFITVFSASVLAATLTGFCQEREVVLHSPDNSLQVTFRTIANNDTSGNRTQLSYSVDFNGKNIIASSAMSLDLNGKNALGANVKITKAKDT